MTTACGPEIAPAGFHATPDTVAEGSLLGPFDGRVLDADTGRPIEGALVDAVWAIERGQGVASPAGAEEISAETTASGDYRIPAIPRLPRGSDARVARFTLVVYKHGFVAYRSDRRFDDLSPRFDFSQHANVVRLEKWTPERSHARHLEFLGGTEVREAAAWEAPIASLELGGLSPEQASEAATRLEQPQLLGAPTSAPGGEPGARPLTPEVLLTEAEIRQVTGYQGEFVVGPLTDRPNTSSYASLHFRAVSLPERYDVALRVWSVGIAGGQRQFANLESELPKAQVVNDVGDRSVRAVQGDILAEMFLEARQGVVVLLTCGSAQCHDATDLLALVRTVDRHVPELLGATPAPSLPAPASGPRSRP